MPFEGGFSTPQYEQGVGHFKKIVIRAKRRIELLRKITGMTPTMKITGRLLN